MSILLIEDDVEVAKFIILGLQKHGYIIEHVVDGKQGLESALLNHYQLIIIDRMLPTMDGLSIIKDLREKQVLVPIIILSAMADVQERVDGLNTGGDDYLVKPFALEELIARIEAQLRRDSNQVYLEVGDLEMDLLKHKVKRNGRRILLQPREYKLLEYLMKNAGRVVTRTMLLENVWEYHFDPQTNVIDVHISRLRQKVDKDFDQPLLKTVRGLGYMLNDT